MRRSAAHWAYAACNPRARPCASGVASSAARATARCVAPPAPPPSDDGSPLSARLLRLSCAPELDGETALRAVVEYRPYEDDIADRRVARHEEPPDAQEELQ